MTNQQPRRTRGQVGMFQIVINVLCALIFTYLTVRRYQSGNDKTFYMTLFCAALWYLNAGLTIYRYYLQKKDES